MKVTVELQGPLHEHPERSLREAVRAAAAEAVENGKKLIRKDTPVATGYLRSRWYVKEDRWNQYRISNDAVYAGIIEKRFQMLARNAPKIEAEFKRLLDKEIPNKLNG